VTSRPILGAVGQTLNFGSPWWLLALLAIPAAVAAQAAARRRARRYAIRFPAVPSMLAAAVAVPPWRRHLPAALALAAMAALALAAAKPQHTVRVALASASIMLVTDHSGSMQATDVSPTRLQAAQKAAHSFIDALPSGVKLGVVAFSAQPDAAQPPTTDHDITRRVVDGQVANGGTATGDALAAALELLRQGKSAPPKASAIILLSDGARTVGRDPIPVAQQAARLKVPIYSVALGTEDALVPNPSPFGAPLPAPPDPETLRRISRITHAQSFAVGDADRLRSIYKGLGAQLGSKTERRELTVGFGLAGLILLLGAAGTSLRFGGRLP
jgi:Ca-activated chloride channel family protein